MTESQSNRWLAAPAAALWTVGVALPLLLVLRMSLYFRGDVSGPRQFETLFFKPGTWTLANFAKILTEPFSVESFSRTCSPLPI